MEHCSCFQGWRVVYTMRLHLHGEAARCSLSWDMCPGPGVSNHVEGTDMSSSVKIRTQLSMCVCVCTRAHMHPCAGSCW